MHAIEPHLSSGDAGVLALHFGMSRLWMTHQQFSALLDVN